MAVYTYKTGQAKRKDFKVAWAGAKKGGLLLLGKGVEDMPISMNATTNENDDVLGNHVYEVASYAETMTIDPVYVDGNDEYSTWLNDIVYYRKTLDEVRTSYVGYEDYVTDETGNMRAWKQDAVVNITDFATGLTGVNIPHEVHFVDERTFGHIDKSTGEFVEDDLGA